MSWHRAFRTRRFGGRFVINAVASVFALGLAAETQAQTISQGFNATTIGPGGTSRLTYTITNPTASPITDLAFTNNLPVVPNSVTVAPGGEVSTTCPGNGGGLPTLTATGGAIAFSSGSVPGSSSCTITVDVTASAVGTYTNTAITLTSSAGTFMSLAADLNVVSTLPGFSKSFSPDAISVGGTSTITYTIDNSLNAGRVGNLDFSETLPTGLSVASPANASTTCISASAPDTTLTAVSGSSTITLNADGNTFLPGFEVLPVGGTCTVTVDVTATGIGEFNAVSGALLADFVSAGTSSDSLSVSTAAIAMTKDFTDDPVNAGANATLQFTIQNNSRSDSATGVSFTDDLTAMFAGATFDSLLSTSCGGSISGVGGTLISLSGGTIAAEGSCVIRVSIGVPNTTATGIYPNTVTDLTATVGGNAVSGNTASDSLSVNGALTRPPVLSMSFPDENAGETITASFTLTNAATAALTNGAVQIPLVPPIPFPGSVTFPMNPCGPGSTFSLMFVDTEKQNLALSGASLAASGSPGSSCTFTADITLPGDLAAGAYTITSEAPTATISAATRTGTPASDSFTVGGNFDINFVKSFSGSAAAGGTVDLIFDLEVPGESPVSGTAISFTDDLSAMLAGATAGAATTNTCGGTLALSAGDTMITYTNGTVAPGPGCRIIVPVSIPTGAATGTVTNTTSALSVTPAGGTARTEPAASATLSVAGLTFNHNFLVNPMLAGGTSTLRYTLGNESASTASGLGFTHSLFAVAGLTATDPALSNSCGGTVTILTVPALGSFITFASGTLAGNSTCTIEVEVTAPATASDGVFESNTSALSGMINGSPVFTAPTAQSLQIQTAQLGFAKSFAADPVTAGNTTPLEFTLSNPTGSTVSSLAFTDDLDVMLSGSLFDSVASDTCGGTATGTGTGLFSYSGGELTAGSDCTITINVSVPGGTTTGNYANITSSLTGLSGGLAISANPASDQLQVLAAGSPTFNKSFAGPTQPGGSTQLTFNITNPVGAGTISNLSFLDDLDAMLSGTTFAGIASDTCGGSAAGTGTGSIAYNGATLADGASCAIVANVNVSSSASSGSFLNTTSSLSQNGLAVANPATASLTVEPAPTFSKSFGGTILQGQTTSLLFTIDNSASTNAISSAAFTDVMPSEITIANPPSATSNCGGTTTAVAGSSTISLSGGGVSAGSTCNISVNVVSSTVGSHVNTTGDLTSTGGNSGTATATITVNSAPAPGFSKAFGGSISQGGVTTLTFTVDNSSALVEASAITFTDSMPSTITVASTPNSSTTCTGGSVTAVAGSSTISFSGGTVAASSSCTVQVDVTSSNIGGNLNTTGSLSTSLGTSSPASATLNVTAAPTPGFSKAFSPSSIVQGDVSTLTFTVDNASAFIDATALSFTDVLPTNMFVAATPNASTTCTGGTLTAVANSGTISYTGGTVSASSSCTVSVNVTSAVVGTPSNTSGALSSSLGTSGTATASLSVTNAPVPNFSKAFGPSSIVQGDVSTLTFTIDNSTALVAANSLAFTDNFPAGMSVAATPNASTTCGSGTVNATTGNAFVSLSGGTVALGATCTVQVDVTSATIGSASNTSGDLTSDLGNSGTASAALNVTAAPAPTFSKAFSPASIVQGDVSTLTLTIDNTATLIDATSLAFTDTFPTGMTVAATPNASATCTGGTITANAGDGSISYSGGTVTATNSCTVQVDVTAINVGPNNNTSGDLTSDLGSSGTASATLTVTAAPAPGFSKVFSPNSIDTGDVSTLTFTVNNAAALVSADSVSFRDVFPSGMIVASAPNVTNTCGGTVTANAGDGSVNLLGGQAPASGNCTISVDVTATAVGSLTNVSDALTSSLGTSGSATDTLTTTLNPNGTLTIVQLSDTDASFSFSSSEPSLNFIIATSGGGGTRGPISLLAGTYTINQTRPSGFGNFSLRCSDSDSVGVASSGALTVNLAASESVTCTYSSADNGSINQQVIQDFLNRRMNLLLSSEPSRSRRINRLKRGLGGSQVVSFNRGDLR